MGQRKTIPTKDAEFDVWQNTLITAVSINATTWTLDQNWLTNEVIPAQRAWGTAYDVYKNPATRTTVMTATKNEKRAAYEKYISAIIGNLKVNPNVSNEVLLSLGIHKPDRTPSPAPVPASYPEAIIDSSVIRRITVKCHDTGSKSYAKPHGVHGVEIKWIIAAENPGIDGLVNSAFDTASPYTLEFNETDRGKSLWLCLRWENTRGEKGPWGEIVMAIIP